MRWIVHCDADAFYAAVEQRDDPSLRGQPIAVGQGSGRGVVMTASYEARAFGVRSAMPAAEALRRCPTLRFVPPRMHAYRDASQAIFRVYRNYTDVIEPLALDEAYLDITHHENDAATPVDIASAIREQVRMETELTVSAGISYGKFLAKLASEEGKPDGLFEIRFEQARAYLENLPVQRLHGVGPRTAERLLALGITTAGQLTARPVSDLERHLGKLGRDLWHLASGIDERPVEPNRERKSISSETTFRQDKHGLMPLLAALGPICEDAARRAERAGVRGNVVVVKIKDASHQVRTRQRRLAVATRDAFVMHEIAAELLATRVPLNRPVRLLGVGLAGLTDGDELQLPLFESNPT